MQRAEPHRRRPRRTRGCERARRPGQEGARADRRWDGNGWRSAETGIVEPSLHVERSDRRTSIVHRAEPSRTWDIGSYESRRPRGGSPLCGSGRRRTGEKRKPRRLSSHQSLPALHCADRSAGLLAAAPARPLVRYVDNIFPRVKLRPDITYGTAVDQITQEPVTLKLDMYTPIGDTDAARPAIVWVHGGSFCCGDKDSPELIDEAHQFAMKGYVNVSIDYRLRRPGLCPRICGWSIASSVSSRRRRTHRPRCALPSARRRRSSASTRRASRSAARRPVRSRRSTSATRRVIRRDEA